MSRVPDSASSASIPRWERRKEVRPAELLAAALELFVEKGYAGTRLDDVAARAGVSKGTLYLYFANKEDLFKALVRENVVRAIDQAASEALSHQGSSAELLSELIVGWWRDYGNTPAGGITKLIMAESSNFPEIATFFLEEVIEPWHRLLGSAIERGIRSGEFRKVDVPTFVQMLSAPLVMLCVWRFSFGPCSHRPVDEGLYLQTLVDTVLRGLKSEPDGARLATKRTDRGAKRPARASAVARLSRPRKTP